MTRIRNTSFVSRTPLLLALLIFAACGDAHVGNRQVTDALGRTVSLPDTIRRVITLAPNLTEIAFAAGAADHLAAVTTADDYPPSVASLPRISALPVDFEAIISHQPDLVIASADVNSARDIQAMEAFGVPVYAISFQSLEDVFDAIETTGELVGTQEHATHAADSLRQRLQKLADGAQAADDQQPRVLVLIGIETLYSFGRGSYVNDMVELAGGRSVTADVASPAPVLSDEFVLEINPDVVLIASNRPVSASDVAAARPSWRTLAAVQNERIHVIDPDIVLRAGPRLVEAVEIMRALFSGIDAGEPV